MCEHNAVVFSGINEVLLVLRTQKPGFPCRCNVIAVRAKADGYFGIYVFV